MKNAVFSLPKLMLNSVDDLDASTLLKLRRVNRTFYPIATRILFSHEHKMARSFLRNAPCSNSIKLDVHHILTAMAHPHCNTFDRVRGLFIIAARVYRSHS
jgi:hypothetical protein